MGATWAAGSDAITLQVTPLHWAGIMVPPSRDLASATVPGYFNSFLIEKRFALSPSTPYRILLLEHGLHILNYLQCLYMLPTPETVPQGPTGTHLSSEPKLRLADTQCSIQYNTSGDFQGERLGLFGRAEFQTFQNGTLTKRDCGPVRISPVQSRQQKLHMLFNIGLSLFQFVATVADGNDQDAHYLQLQCMNPRARPPVVMLQASDVPPNMGVSSPVLPTLGIRLSRLLLGGVEHHAWTKLETLIDAKHDTAIPATKQVVPPVLEISNFL
ncbi:hypothetical protein EDB85DRAFT_2273723 [Lactarius pseudohatsudake]|nr:hypothetical protein EDB85DRAFT_2273723 [Lactarius pseudohatsudake]